MTPADDASPDTHAPPPRQYMRRREAAGYLTENGYPVAPNTLTKLASVGGGPVFRKFGRWPVYAPPDLDDWARTRLSAPMRSTSDFVQQTEAAR
jgi:hypothetical protein